MSDEVKKISEDEKKSVESSQNSVNETASDTASVETQPDTIVDQTASAPATDVKKTSQAELKPGIQASRSSAQGGQRRKESRSRMPQPKEAESEFIEKVLSIRRVTKVTKGGKKLSFSALVVVGDGKSRVGYAQEKAGEVAIAIRKAMGTAKKRMVKISLKGTTIPHEIIGAKGGARVLLKPASEGTGVIASGPVRAICDGAGIHNILTKCHRSNNPVNVVKATMDGLTRLKTLNTQQTG